MSQFTLPEAIGKMTIEELEIFLDESQSEFRKKHPHADRNKALVGNPYFKLDGEKIFCIECGQRLGAISFPCPICNEHTVYVYESMLKNPADSRWQRRQYQKLAISSQQEAALYSLKERQHSLNVKESDL